MVAIADFGREERERERMVKVATQHGWIQKVAGWAVDRGNTTPVVVLATTDCPTDIGVLGDIVKKAVDGVHAMPAKMRSIQAAEALQQFVVFSLPLEGLCQMVDPGTEDDLRGMAAHHEYAVLCMNADQTVLVSGVSPIVEVGHA